MPTSRRYAVIKAIADHLKTVTVANGYSHDLAAAVYIGRRKFGDSDPMPCVTLLEIPDIEIPGTRPEAGAAQIGEWEFFVEGFARASDPMEPTKEAYLLMADVTKALSDVLNPENNPRHGKTPKLIYMVGGKLERFDIGGFHVRQAEDAPSVSNFYLRIRTQVVEKLVSPYD